MNNINKSNKTTFSLGACFRSFSTFRANTIKLIILLIKNVIYFGCVETALFQTPSFFFNFVLNVMTWESAIRFRGAIRTW